MSLDRLVLIAAPDRYGRFAHQTFSLLSAWAAAHRFGCHFVPLKYSYFANKYNQFVSFGCSSRARSEFAGKTVYQMMSGVEPDVYGNTKYNLLSLDHSLAFVSELIDQHSRCADITLLELPFDQHPGRLIKSLTPTMHSDLTKVFQPFINSGRKRIIATQKNQKQILVTVHIRRGDVTPKTQPDWFIEDIYYERLIEALYHVLGDTIKIMVLSQGGMHWNNNSLHKHLLSKEIVIEHSSGNGWINQGEIADFSTMLCSDLIVAGQSGFSLLASLIAFGRAQLVVTRHQDSSMPQPIPYCKRVNALTSLNSLEDAIDSILDCTSVQKLIPQV